MDLKQTVSLSHKQNEYKIRWLYQIRPTLSPMNNTYSSKKVAANSISVIVKWQTVCKEHVANMLV